MTWHTWCAKFFVLCELCVVVDHLLSDLGAFVIHKLHSWEALTGVPRLAVCTLF
jgi:hypothetical protein